MPTSVITDSRAYIAVWVGFACGLFSFILSTLTLYVIYRMCESSSSTAQQASEPETNPIRTSDSAVIGVEQPDHVNEFAVEAANTTTATKNNNPKLKLNAGTKFSGYLLLIVSMTCCQVFYDLGYMMYVPNNYSVCMLANFLTFFCGLSVTIWTNVISFVIYYVVMYMSSLDIYGYYPIFFLVAVVGPLIFAMNLVFLPGNFSDTSPGCDFSGPNALVFINVYYWIRIISILANAAIFIRISIRLNYLTKLPQSRTDEATAALAALVRRVKYYPIIQVFIRSGAAWNEFNNYQYQTFESQLMNYICSPSTGACYFFLFLYMQPRAYTVFCIILREWFCCQKEAEASPSPAQESPNLNDEDTDNYFDELDEEELERLINMNNETLATQQPDHSSRLSLSEIFPKKTTVISSENIET